MAAGSNPAPGLRGLIGVQGGAGPAIGIVGGGLMGMALARKLAADGNRVTVLERDEKPGGLATWHDYGGFTWDRFYHVILPTDRYLVAFVDELGLAGSLHWRRTYTGFYVDGRMHSISNNVEFLRFPLLSLVSKLRLAWTMLYGARIDDWESLERTSVETWLVRHSGRTTYEKLWKPLLMSKLGSAYRRVSAVFIWSYIKRLFSARHSAASKEQLGHVAGGYKSIFEQITRDIEASGGSVRTSVTVKAIVPGAGQGICLRTDAGDEHFDRVVCTSPVPVLRKLADASILKVADCKGDIEYLGVICLTIVSTAQIVPYYVVNIADDSVPFTGMIGMSTVVSPNNTGGRFLTYLPKYVQPGDPLFEQSDDQVRHSFLEGVNRMLPDFDPDCIESVHVNRASKVQPLQVLGYSSLVPTVTTQHPDFYVLNTSQFVNATLNNNEVIGAVERFHRAYGEELGAAVPPRRAAERRYGGT